MSSLIVCGASVTRMVFNLSHLVAFCHVDKTPPCLKLFCICGNTGIDVCVFVRHELNSCLFNSLEIKKWLNCFHSHDRQFFSYWLYDRVPLCLSLWCQVALYIIPSYHQGEFSQYIFRHNSCFFKAVLLCFILKRHRSYFSIRSSSHLSIGPLFKLSNSSGSCDFTISRLDFVIKCNLIFSSALLPNELTLRPINS